jgi:mRNA interferase MazF
MLRGEVWFVDFAAVRGSEANKDRPAVIVSNNGLNRRAAELGRGVVTLVPLTSKTARVYDFEVLLPSSETGLARESKAQAEQVRTIDVSRLIRRAGRLGPAAMTDLDAALRLHLDL